MRSAVLAVALVTTVIVASCQFAGDAPTPRFRRQLTLMNSDDRHYDDPAASWSVTGEADLECVVTHNVVPTERRTPRRKGIELRVRQGDAVHHVLVWDDYDVRRSSRYRLAHLGGTRYLFHFDPSSRWSRYVLVDAVPRGDVQRLTEDDRLVRSVLSRSIWTDRTLRIEPPIDPSYVVPQTGDMRDDS